MKTYLSFNDQSENDCAKLKDIMQASNMKAALYEIGQEIFRPARKHGYNNSKLNKLLVNRDVSEAIGILEDMFYEILQEKEVSLE